MGRALSKWYFDEGGLYLSTHARNHYFLLAAGLSKASQDSKFPLKVPSAQERSKLDDSKIEVYRSILKLTPERFPNSDSLQTWTFGQDVPTATAEETAKAAKDKKFAQPTDETIKDASRFQDYVLLQTLSSRLRSALTDDLVSRRSPAEPPK